jgi:hypothetical protein
MITPTIYVFINGGSLHKALSFFVVNVVTHMFIDDLKVNRKVINLITDQTVHLLQIATTAIILL